MAGRGLRASRASSDGLVLKALLAALEALASLAHEVPLVSRVMLDWLAVLVRSVLEDLLVRLASPEL